MSRAPPVSSPPASAAWVDVVARYLEALAERLTASGVVRPRAVASRDEVLQIERADVHRVGGVISAGSITIASGPARR